MHMPNKWALKRKLTDHLLVLALTQPVHQTMQLDSTVYQESESSITGTAQPGTTGTPAAGITGLGGGDATSTTSGLSKEGTRNGDKTSKLSFLKSWTQILNFYKPSNN